MTTISRLALILGLAGAVATPFTAWGAEPAGKAVTPSASKGDGMEKVADCRDGAAYWSKTTRHMGACRGHGGVASWADGSPVKSNEKTSEYR